LETIAFYSYTEGAGRSLFLAYAARHLARLGKRVVALDLDLEAPGLHYKLLDEAECTIWDNAMGGAVPYLIAAAQGAPPPLESHLYGVDEREQDKGGWLRLMPAGPAPTKAYWIALKQLGEQVRFTDPSGLGLMLLLDLHARIEDELEPDYLLIDVRPGVTELGGLATTVLAETVVCLFEATRESLEGTLTMIEAMQAAPRLKGRQPVRAVPVLSQSENEPSRQEQHLEEGLKRLLRLGQDRLLLLRGAHERRPYMEPEMLQALFLSVPAGDQEALGA
jgi:cellulose biosynthesis protein BcsQ